MDSKDFRLLAALYDNARQSYRSLGQRVSLSAPAVRERVQVLESKGIIQGYWVSIDPSIFHRMDLLVFYLDEMSHDTAVKALAANDVAWVAWKIDGGLTVQVWPTTRDHPIQDLTKVLGKEPSSQTWVEHHDDNSLSRVDWRILDVLLDQPRIGLGSLCKTTGLSPKTVRKHLDQLIRNETIYVTPKLGSLADSGELVYHIAVAGNVGLQDLRQALGDLVLVQEAQRPPMKYLLCRADDLADVTTRTAKVSKHPEVESIRVTLNKEILIATDFMHRLVHEEAEEG